MQSSDSEEEERGSRSAKSSVDLSASPWLNNFVNLEDVSSRENFHLCMFHGHERI